MNDETAVNGCFRIFCPPEANPRRDPPVGYRRAAWPLILPLAVIVSLFLSLSWLGVFRAAARHWRARPRRWCSLFCAVAALYPLRFFRLPRNDEIDRRIERANLLEHTPVRVQTDRPSRRCRGLRPGALARASEAAWRHGSPASVPICRARRARARPVGSARRRRAAVRHRLRLFVGLRRRQYRRCCSSASDRCGRAAAAHRCLGDAAGLYRQAADLPGRRSGGRSGGLSPCRKAATCRCASPAAAARKR